MVSAPIFCRRFIGRRASLDLLAERYRAAAAGEGSIVLVHGEPGIGKSRLISEFVSMLRSQQALVGVGHCLPFAQTPFGPVADALRALISAQPKVLDAGDPLRQTLAPLLPEFHEERSSPQEDAQIEKRRQLEAIVEALRRFAAIAPVAGIVEDLHWADLATLEFLQFLIPSLGSARFMLVLTFRSDELLGREPPLRSVVAKLKSSSSVWEMKLDALTQAEMGTLIQDALEGHPMLAGEAVAAVRARAEGNPLYAEELLKSALESASGRSSRSELPLTLSESVLERLGSFDDRERDLLKTAAAIGTQFEPELLAEIADLSIDDIVPALKHAINMQLIMEESNGVIRYAFRHELTRDAVYGELIAAEKRPLHAKIARRIETMPDTAARTAELAYHWWEARDLAKAARYNEAAGDAAWDVYAFADGVRFYERALHCHSEGDERKAELRVKLARALFQAGSIARSRSERELALKYFEQAGDFEKVYRNYMALSMLVYEINEPESAKPYAERAIEAAQKLRPNNESAYWEALLNRAMLSIMAGDSTEALDFLNRAAPIAASGNANLAAAWHQWRGAAMTLDDDAGAADAEFREAERFARLSPLPLDILTVCFNYAWGMTMCGRRQSAYAAAERGFGWAAEHGYFGYNLPFSTVIFGKICLLFGDLAGARHHLEKALGLNVQGARVRAMLAGLAMRVGLRTKDEDLVRRYAREELLAEMLSGIDPVSLDSVWGFVECLAAGREYDRARQILKRALEIIRPPIQFDDLWLGILAGRLGEPADVDALRKLMMPGNHRVKRAHIALIDAECAYRAADRDRAKILASEAVGLFHDLGWSWHEAQALEVADQRAKALAIYRDIGDRYDEERLEQALIPVNRRGRPKTALTSREREIAKLVAEGKSNRAIAEALFISERTVESHVSTIIEKLGATSRVEIAAQVLKEPQRK